MANPLIPMEQAADMLGMSVEKLTELRSNNEIFGYRDGSSWKFKMSELQRVADDLGVTLGSAPDVADSVVDLAGESGIGSGLGDSILGLDDEESSGGYVEEESSIEILSRPIDAVSDALDLDGDELKLEEPELNLQDSGELNLRDDAGTGDVIDDADDALSFGSSSLELAAGSSKKDLSAEDTGDLLDDVEGGGGSPSDTGKMLADDDDMLLSEDDLFSDELSLSEEAVFEDSAELSSDFEDSDIVMEDSDSDSELVFEASGSGINLSANESGISLDDEPLDLSGSDIDSLELPDDDDMIVLEDPADPAAATMMQEDDFNLTPLEDAMDDETSGSQIIALEDSEIYADESSATVLGDSDMLEPAGMLDDGGMYDPNAAAYGADPMAPALAPAGMPGAAVAPAAPEAPYSIWQVLSLGLVASLLILGGMIAYDICRNMWMPDDSVISSGILPFFLELFNIGN